MAVLYAINTNPASSGGGGGGGGDSVCTIIQLNPGEASKEFLANTFVGWILIEDNSNPTIKIGTTAGGEEIVPEEPIDTYRHYELNMFFNDLTTIYFSGLTENSVVKIYKCNTNLIET